MGSVSLAKNVPVLPAAHFQAQAQAQPNGSAPQKGNSQRTHPGASGIFSSVPNRLSAPAALDPRAAVILRDDVREALANIGIEVAKAKEVVSRLRGDQDFAKERAELLAASTLPIEVVRGLFESNTDVFLASAANNTDYEKNVINVMEANKVRFDRLETSGTLPQELDYRKFPKALLFDSVKVQNIIAKDHEAKNPTDFSLTPLKRRDVIRIFSHPVIGLGFRFVRLQSGHEHYEHPDGRFVTFAHARDPNVTFNEHLQGELISRSGVSRKDYVAARKRLKCSSHDLI